MLKKKVILFTILLLNSFIVNAYQLDRVSVHDPSVVWEPASRYYYIFGSHHSVAKTRDLMSWTSASWTWGRMNDDGRVVGGVSNENAFRNCAKKTVIKDGVEVEFPNFDAHDWSAAYGDYSIGGNMWAPDVIYNDIMEKWCMYTAQRIPASQGAGAALPPYSLNPQTGSSISPSTPVNTALAAPALPRLSMHDPPQPPSLAMRIIS